jgi:hypothetical protein
MMKHQWPWRIAVVLTSAAGSVLLCSPAASAAGVATTGISQNSPSAGKAGWTGYTASAIAVPASPTYSSTSAQSTLGVAGPFSYSCTGAKRSAETQLITCHLVPGSVAVTSVLPPVCAVLVTNPTSPVTPITKTHNAQRTLSTAAAVWFQGLPGQ